MENVTSAVVAETTVAEVVTGTNIENQDLDLDASGKRQRLKRLITKNNCPIAHGSQKDFTKLSGRRPPCN